MWSGPYLQKAEGLVTLASEGDILTVPRNSSQRQQCPFPVQSEGDITQLLFDVTHDVTLGSGGERVATLGQNLYEIVC